MTNKMWNWGFVVGTGFLFFTFYTMLYDTNARTEVHDYAIMGIKEILELHTEKLEILVGSQYEIHSKLDQLIKEK